MEEESKTEVSPVEEAINISLELQGFDTNEVNPTQESTISSTIEHYKKTGKYETVNKAPVEELGLLAYCKITGTTPPEKLRWEWGDKEDVQKKLDSLTSREENTNIEK